MNRDDHGRGQAPGIAHRAGARVSVELDWDSLEPAIEVRFTQQRGPSPSADVVAVWEQSVVHGVRYALKVARALPCTVRVTKLCGDPAHSLPTLMAAAAATAVWEALEYEPPPEVRARLQELVTESRDRGPLWLADFSGG
jgi:hypothetical protein